jgi:flagellar motor protein MotB
MNKNLNAYIEYIKDNYQNANDYILKSSFNEFKKTYNVNQLQQKNKEIIEQDQEAKSQTVQENVPGDVLEETEDGGAEDEGEAEEEQKGA